MIITDQHAAGAMSCVGNPHVHTPAVDSIAARGVRFTRGYVTQPLCLPCRSSIQTGRFPHEIGTTTNGSRLEGDPPMLGRLLAESGYATAYFGKWHVGVPLQESATGYAYTSENRSDAEIARMASEFLASLPVNRSLSPSRCAIHTMSASLPGASDCRKGRYLRHPKIRKNFPRYRRTSRHPGTSPR